MVSQTAKIPASTTGEVSRREEVTIVDYFPFVEKITRSFLNVDRIVYKPTKVVERRQKLIGVAFVLSDVTRVNEVF